MPKVLNYRLGYIKKISLDTFCRHLMRVHILVLE